MIISQLSGLLFRLAPRPLLSLRRHFGLFHRYRVGSHPNVAGLASNLLMLLLILLSAFLFVRVIDLPRRLFQDVSRFVLTDSDSSANYKLVFQLAVERSSYSKTPKSNPTTQIKLKSSATLNGNILIHTWSP